MNLLNIHDDVIISHIVPYFFSHKISEEKSILKCYVNFNDFSLLKNNGIIFKKLGRYYNDYEEFTHIGILFLDYLKCKTSLFGPLTIFNTCSEMNINVCGDTELSCASQTLIRTIKFVCSLRLTCKNFNRVLSSQNISHALNIYFLHCSNDNIKLSLLCHACSFAYNSIEATKILVESATEKHTHLDFFNFINSGAHLFDAVENGNIDTVKFLLSSAGECASQLISNVKDTNTILDYAILTSNPSTEIVTTIIRMYGEHARDLILRQFRNEETIFHRFIRECEGYNRESLDIRHEIFKILLDAAGPEVFEFFRFKNNFNTRTILDVARGKCNWEIMLDIPEIENEILNEAYHKGYWPIVSDILMIHAKRYGEKHGIIIVSRLEVDHTISINR